ncbi:tripartite tricarboxylate transporter substrate-binding protein [Achromobacter spanius]|uniref:tripartite tricarboxylate transporter substrate-binding protein n=1 Tax=Achromobacter spanius TaxID=217203 RepID=UPI00320AD3F7
MRFPIKRWACGALASAFSAAVMAAAPYPDKPIRLIAPWPAGGTPAPIVDKLSSALNAVMSDPAYSQRLIAMGAELHQSTPAAFTAFWAEELDRYRQLIQSAGIQVN